MFIDSATNEWISNQETIKIEQINNNIKYDSTNFLSQFSYIFNKTALEFGLSENGGLLILIKCLESLLDSNEKIERLSCILKYSKDDIQKLVDIVKEKLSDHNIKDYVIYMLALMNNISEYYYLEVSFITMFTELIMDIIYLDNVNYKIKDNEKYIINLLLTYSYKDINLVEYSSDRKFSINSLGIDYAKFTDEDWLDYKYEDIQGGIEHRESKNSSIISYKGADFEVDGNLLIRLVDYDYYDVVIPPGIEIIGRGAFMDYSGSKIIIPEGVVAIEEGAFFKCILREVVFPSTLKFIGEYAFYDIGNLKEVVIPEGTKMIGTGAFCECRGLGKVTLPSTLIRIDKRAFSLCKPLDQVIIPKSVQMMGEAVFSYTECKIYLEAKEIPMLWDSAWNSNERVGTHYYYSVDELGKETLNYDELYKAIQNCDVETVKEIASKYELTAFFNHRSNSNLGYTYNTCVYALTRGPFAFVARKNHDAQIIKDSIIVLETLMVKGFNINCVRGDDYMTILLSAILCYGEVNDNEEAMEALDEAIIWMLEHGADPYIENMFFSSAAQIIKKNGKDIWDEDEHYVSNFNKIKPYLPKRKKN